jgi:HSP20 family protein
MRLERKLDREIHQLQKLANHFLRNRLEQVRSLPVNLYESESRLLLVIPAAGLKREQIELDYHNEKITVTMRKELPSMEGEALRKEIREGEFTRTIAVPVPVKADSIQARFEDGLLKIEMDKQESFKPRKITIE